MNRMAVLMVAIMIVGWCCCMAAAEPMTVGTAEWRPWQIMENGHLSGITPKILREISKRTGLAMEIQWLPQKRLMIAFETGTIDMEPTVNPVWRECHRDISVYTQPFYVTGDVFLVRRESGIRGSSVKEFYGMKLGCGLGYYYPEGFQEAFENGDIHREDNPVAEKNLVKLSLKRIDGIIVDKVQVRYIMKRVGLNPDDFATAYAFKPSELSMRLHKNRKDLLPVINAALAGMLADGTIDRIVDSYVR